MTDVKFKIVNEKYVFTKEYIDDLLKLKDKYNVSESEMLTIIKVIEYYNNTFDDFLQKIKTNRKTLYGKTITITNTQDAIQFILKWWYYTPDYNAYLGDKSIQKLIVNTPEYGTLCALKAIF